MGEHVHTAAPLIGDFSCSDKTLNALHAHSDSVFSDAITTVLHDAMEPEYL